MTYITQFYYDGNLGDIIALAFLTIASIVIVIRGRSYRKGGD